MKDRTEIVNLLQRLGEETVLVAGDVMLDRYWWGDASRLSPEAPVPVVGLQRVSSIPGGAANVAANVAALGTGVLLAGIIGDDETGRDLTENLEGHGIGAALLALSSRRPTTTKTRVIVHNQQIARIDEESVEELSQQEEDRVQNSINEILDGIAVLVLSDYAKGFLTRSLSSHLIDAAKGRGIPVIADPKTRDLSKYNGATILTPNLQEALIAAGIDGKEVHRADEAADILLQRTSIESLLITLGEHGMKYYVRGADPVSFPSSARQVFDVTGAGDTVVAILAAMIAAKADILTAIKVANLAAGIAVEKVGTSTVSLAELRHALQEIDQ